MFPNPLNLIQQGGVFIYFLRMEVSVVSFDFWRREETSQSVGFKKRSDTTKQQNAPTGIELTPAVSTASCRGAAAPAC